MALKACKECGKEVSTEARACPHCGVDKPAQSIDHNFGCALFAAGISLILMLGLCSAGSNVKGTNPKPASKNPARDAFIEALEREFPSAPDACFSAYYRCDKNKDADACLVADGCRRHKI